MWALELALCSEPGSSHTAATALPVARTLWGLINVWEANTQQSQKLGWSRRALTRNVALLNVSWRYSLTRKQVCVAGVRPAVAESDGEAPESLYGRTKATHSFLPRCQGCRMAALLVTRCFAKELQGQVPRPWALLVTQTGVRAVNIFEVLNPEEYTWYCWKPIGGPFTSYHRTFAHSSL